MLGLTLAFCGIVAGSSVAMLFLSLVDIVRESRRRSRLKYEPRRRT